MKHFAFKQKLTATAVGLLVVGATGCTIYPERQDFGEAVRHMQAVQDAPPEARAPSQDGMRGQQILKLYREDVAKPAEVKREIVIEVGGRRN